MRRVSLESVEFANPDGKGVRIPYTTGSTVRGGAELLRITAAPEPGREPVRLRVTFRIPIAGIQGFWTPYRTCDLHNQTTLSWEHRTNTVPAGEYPCVAFTDRELRSRLFIGFTEHTAVSGWSLALSQAGECYIAEFTYPDAGYLPVCEWGDVEFYIEEDGGNLFGAIGRFSGYCEALARAGTSPPPVPARADDPVYCTWYAAHGAVDRGWVESTARAAKDLGFGQFILDDGWQYDRYRRVGSLDEDTSDWFTYTGDWFPSEKKFPDFAGHVAYMQSLGFKYLVWWDPYTVGRGTRTAARMRRFLRGRRFEAGRKMLCTQDETVRRHVLETAERLVSDYGLDGFKVDYLCAVHREPCADPGHDHFTPSAGRAVYETMVEMLAAVRKIKPDFNMMHTGGPYWNAISTSARGVDVPFDVDGNIYFLAYIKAAAGDLPLQSDPLFWSSNDGAEDVARHLISSVFFVPCVSVDLQSIPGEQRELIRRWIGFYRENEGFLRAAPRRFENIGSLVSGITAESGSRRITGVFRNTPVKLGGAEETILLNGASGEDVYILASEELAAEVFGPDFKPLRRERVSVGIDRLEIPVGGYARLRPGFHFS